MVLTIKKLTRVEKKLATAINLTIPNYIVLPV